jgi:hypothetical protein
VKTYGWSDVGDVQHLQQIVSKSNSLNNKKMNLSAALMRPPDSNRLEKQTRPGTRPTILTVS